MKAEAQTRWVRTHRIAGPVNLVAVPPPNSFRVYTPFPRKQPHQTLVRGPCQGPTYIQGAITPPDPWANLSPPSSGSVPSADLSFSTPSAIKWAHAISAQAYMTTAIGFPGCGRLLPFRDVEKRKPSSTAGGTVLGVALQRILQRFLKKLKTELPYTQQFHSWVCI